MDVYFFKSKERSWLIMFYWFSEKWYCPSVDYTSELEQVVASRWWLDKEELPKDFACTSVACSILSSRFDSFYLYLPLSFFCFEKSLCQSTFLFTFWSYLSGVLFVTRPRVGSWGVETLTPIIWMLPPRDHRWRILNPLLTNWNLIL